MPPSKKNIPANGKRKLKEGGEGSSEFVRIIFSPVSRGIRLPTVFMDHHGQSLKPNTEIILKVPTRASWPVKLRETDTGLWLGRGWEEFAAYYEIEAKHFLLFKYDGRAQFSVNIMDPTGSEIEYPMDVEDADEANVEHEVEGHHEEGHEKDEEVGFHEEEGHEEDEEVGFHEEEGHEEEGYEEDEEVGFHEEEGHEEEGYEEDEEVGFHEEEGHEEKEEVDEGYGDDKHENEQVDEDYESDEGHEEDGEEGSMSDFDDFDVNPYRLFMGVRGQGEKKRFDSYRQAERFRSANPFFLHFMQPTYVTDRYMVGLNLNCVEEFLPKNSDLNKTCVLKISIPNSDKVWNLSCHAYQGGRRSAIMKGWKEFAVENKIRVADVCVFELVNPQDLHFKITIFRNT